MKVLFLLKTTSEYGCTTQPSKSGLRNSAGFVVDAINDFKHTQATIDFCIDGNDIDRKLTQYRPDICIFEAVWVSPDKLKEIIYLHPAIKFITRVHSKAAFIGMEGNAIEWLKEYEKISVVSFNHLQTSHDFNKIGLKNIYLPNIYPHYDYVECENIHKKHLYKIGCFGSIRPFKNQLNQAIAAILFAERRNSHVHFYINSTRIEQRGESVLKNLRSLFSNSRHKLIECEWLEHDEFLKLISQMDASCQVSFTETFNIVTADCISQHIPMVVSEEIEWLSCAKANPNDASDIAEKLEFAIENKKECTEDNIKDLNIYNHNAINTWFKYLKRS
jgi:hypothetical protein